jgi:hypothetical protein
VTIDESGEESSGQPEGAVADSEKGPHLSPERTPSPQGKASSDSAKQVTMQQFSKQGPCLLSVLLFFFSDSWILILCFNLEIFRIQGSLALLSALEASALSGGLCA